MKKLLVKNCSTCPLNTRNINLDLIEVQCYWVINSDDDISYNINLKKLLVF